MHLDQSIEVDAGLWVGSTAESIDILFVIDKK